MPAVAAVAPPPSLWFNEAASLSSAWRPQMANPKSRSAPQGGGKEPTVVAKNPKAFHDYSIEERLEAGIALQGTEVKSLRDGQVTLRDSFARVENGEVFLYHMHISPYSHGNIMNHDPLRKRKLLLQRREIDRLYGKTQQRGYALVPLSVYFARGKAKIELGLARGRQAGDKRDVLRGKAAQREIERALKDRRG